MSSPKLASPNRQRSQHALNAKSERIELLTWRQIWRDLANKNSITWQAFVIFVPFACLAATVYDHNRLVGDDRAWLLTGLAGYVVAVIAMVLLSAYSRVNRWQPSLTTLVGFALVGVARGLIVFQVGYSFGLIPSTELAFRALGSAFLFVWVLVGSNVVVTAASRFGTASESLKQELAYLAGTRAALSKNIEGVRTALRTRIDSVLAPAIEGLFVKLEGTDAKSSKNAVADLQQIIENVVRPLSHRVATPTFLAESSQKPQPAKPTTVLETLRGNVAMGDVILPMFVASATVLTALPSTIIAMKLLPAFGVIVMGWISVYVFLLVARYVFRDLFMPIWLAALATYFLPFLAGSGVIFGGWGALFNLPPAAGAEFFSLAGSLSFAAFWFQVLELKRAQSLRELAWVAETQRQLVSTMRQEVWVLQRHLASTLHGPVQAALFASIFKFSQSDVVREEQVDELIVNLDESLALLSKAPGLDGREFGVVWQELVDFWSGVCTLECNFNDEMLAQIASSNLALSCALEVIREAVNNAVRHAGATKISVCLETEDNLMNLQIKNNGTPLPPHIDEGFGTSLIKDVTHSYSLTSLSKPEGDLVTELRASIVMALPA